MKTRKLQLKNRVVSVLSPDKAQHIRGASDVQCGTDSGPMCTIADNECYETYQCTQQECQTQSCPSETDGCGGGNSGGNSTSPCGPSVNNGKLYFWGLGSDWT